MASNSGTLPRRRSMTDAFHFFRNPDAANSARNDLINMVEEMRQRNAHLDDFANSLPKITEKDLVSLGQSDSTCPICLTSLLAILAEEETAVAMDSPAHPIEELGVTRLAQTCGHIFCRKDIRGWLYEGHTTCPTCRTPFITQPEGAAASTGPGGFPMFGTDTSSSFDAFLEDEVTRAFETFLRGHRNRAQAQEDGANESSAGGRRGGQASGDRDEEPMHEARFEYNHSRDEFSGMYS